MPLGRKAASMLRALDKFLVKGLGSIKEQVARDLGGFLRANGLGKAAVRARDLREDKPDRRYRAFVELRIALEEAVVKLYRPDHLRVPLPQGVTIVARESRALAGPAELVEACRRFDGTAAALSYLQTEPDLSGLSGDDVEVLMANDDIRERAGRALRAAPVEVVTGWIRHLVHCSNGLSRRGAYLLVNALEPDDAARETLPSWSRPEDQDDAFEAFHPRRMDMREGLRAGLDPEAELPLEARRFALRMVARWARKGEPEKWEALVGDDPELLALVKIGRFRSEEVGPDRLRSWASSLEEPELRALACLQCWMEGDVDPRAHQTELQRNRENLHLLLAPLRNTSRLEGFLKQWLASLELSRPVAEREKAVEELLASGDRRVAHRLLHTLSDPSPVVRKRLFPYLCGALGLLPVRLSVDLAPLQTTAFENFSSDVMRGFERWLLPVLPVVPDARLAAYVGYLLGRSGKDAVPAEGVRALGSAMIGELAVLLGHEEGGLQVLALRELEALRADARAARILEDHEAGKDPLENAVEKLLVEDLRVEGRQALTELDRESTVTRLLEIARTRKAAREPILEVLAGWRAEAAVPFMIKLLGSPLPDMVRGKPGNRETRWLEKSVTAHLEAYGEAARSPLEAALGSENWTVRHHAAHLLGVLGDELSTPGLARALEEESEEETRNVVIQALGSTGGSAAVDALEPLARSSVAGEQLKAVRALQGIHLDTTRKLLGEMLENARDLGLKREIKKALDGMGGG